MTTACGDSLLFQNTARAIVLDLTTSAMTRPESRPLFILARPLYNTKTTVLDNVMTAKVVSSLSLHKSFCVVQLLSPRQQSLVN